jgi:hypothetical protein
MSEYLQILSTVIFSRWPDIPDMCVLNLGPSEALSKSIGEELSEIDAEYLGESLFQEGRVITQRYFDGDGPFTEGISFTDEMAIDFVVRIIRFSLRYAEQPDPREEDWPRHSMAARSLLQTEFPVKHSPISGETLAKILSAAGSTGSFSAAYFTYQHGGIEPIMVGLLAAGGLKIVIGAADGLAEGFRAGFRYHLLRLMGVPQKVAVSKTRKAIGEAETPAARRTRHVRPDNSR